MNYKIIIAVFISLLMVPFISLCQEIKPPIMDGTEGEVFKQKKTDSADVEISSMKLNEFDGPLSSLKFGGGFLYEFAGFSQDEVSKEQVTTESNFKMRDARITMSGKFKIKREITWKVGVMFDGNAKSWYMRETGLLIKVPELSGKIFIGRTKEGYSLSKAMVGYAIWNFERMASIDILPILADGVKYLGYLPKQKIVLNLGAFVNWVSKSQSFATYQYQFVSRVAYLPIYKDVYKPVLHIGGNYRYGKIKDGEIRARSKPEVSGAPYFIDSETMVADYSNSVGGELYFRSRKFLFGSEFHAHFLYSPENDNPVFAGGEAFVAYVFTGEIRPYYASIGNFGFIKVNNPVFKGGWGGLEGVMRFTNFDLNDGAIKGGEFWRITPTLNWYLSDNVRLHFAYGYCVLNRYEKQGATNIFQTRVLFML